jgi:hypothetical protein
MKLILLMYLEEDAELVAKILRNHDIEAFSRLEAEGWTKSLPSPWSGERSPNRSEFVVTLVAEDRAAELLRAVAECSGCADERHPIHAVQLDVDRMTSSLTSETDA